jgi:DNA helicase HerA-like ATPase
MNPCIAKALTGRHILLIGSTGSGKTYAASNIAEHLDCFVFINTQEEKSATDICQVELEDPSEIGDALEEGYRAIEFTPSFDKKIARAELQILREELFNIGSVMKAQANVLELPMWITVFVDETQVYAPLHTQLDAENFWTRGRGYGIRGVAISRQPQELSKEIVNNCEFELIFQLGHYALPYFKAFKIPIAEHEAWLDKEHHFLLYDKKTITECKPI